MTNKTYVINMLKNIRYILNEKSEYMQECDQELSIDEFIDVKNDIDEIIGTLIVNIMK